METTSVLLVVLLARVHIWVGNATQDPNSGRSVNKDHGLLMPWCSRNNLFIENFSQADKDLTRCNSRQK